MSRTRALSSQALAVVAALASTDDWRHGYDIMAQAGVKSGTLYPLLMRLEAQGLLEARWVQSPQPGRPPRHVYRLTAAGRGWVPIARGDSAEEKPASERDGGELVLWNGRLGGDERSGLPGVQGREQRTVS